MEESAADGVCDDGFASLVTQGSSSGVVTLAVMLFVLFGMSVKDGRKMECFWQEMTLLSVACLITYILRSCNVLSQELPMEKVTDILTFSAMSVIMTIVSVVGCGWYIPAITEIITVGNFFGASIGYCA